MEREKEGQDDLEVRDLSTWKHGVTCAEMEKAAPPRAGRRGGAEKERSHNAHAHIGQAENCTLYVGRENRIQQL